MVFSLIEVNLEHFKTQKAIIIWKWEVIYNEEWIKYLSSNLVALEVDILDYIKFMIFHDF